jgi:hypothetical protein
MPDGFGFNILEFWTKDGKLIGKLGDMQTVEASDAEPRYEVPYIADLSKPYELTLTGVILRRRFRPSASQKHPRRRLYERLCPDPALDLLCAKERRRKV